MKYSFIIVVLLIVSVAFMGCGKSDLQKKLETELSGDVTKLHDGGMAMMNKAKDVVGQLDAALAMHDSLAKAHPKEAAGHSADDIVAAKEKLAAVKTSMDAWMKNHKPYNMDMGHEQLISQIKKDKDDLLKMKADGETALAAATAALESHKQVAADLLAKFTKKGKK